MTEGMELTDLEIEQVLKDTHFYNRVAAFPKEILTAQVAKVLKNLPTEQEIREQEHEKLRLIYEENCSEVCIAVGLAGRFARESERKEIAEALFKIIANTNYDMASVIRYLDKLIIGQSPKEV